MDDDSSSTADPLRAWLEATGAADDAPDAAAHGGNHVRGRLLTLATLTTVAALALGGVALLDRGGAVATPVAPGPVAAPTPSPLASPAAPSPAAPLAAHPGSEAVAATAVIAVRASAEDDSYVDTAVAASVQPHDGFDLVTVLAWVLRREGRQWTRGHLAHYAVAVGGGASGPSALGAPWQVPPPATATPPRRWKSVGDAGMSAAAQAALHDAGYRDIAGLELRNDSALPAVVSALATGVAPGDEVARRHEVLLSADTLAVLGAPAVTDVPIPLEHP